MPMNHSPLNFLTERAQYLHLFLHARGLLSASVRLGNIGPYRSQQLLLHIVRPLVAAEASRCARFRTGMLDEDDGEFNMVMDGPANTWPLGEVIAARHDSQYSRVFNS
jgi:urease accessory protein